MTKMSDETVWNHMRYMIEVDGKSVSEAVRQMANTWEDMTESQYRSAYYRHRNVLQDQDIDSKASVSHPKPLEDGTEGDSITDVSDLAEKLLDDAWNLYQNIGALIADIDDLKIKTAGTERMSRVAKELGL